MHTLRLGIDNLLATPPAWLKAARLGVLVNQASLTRDYRYTHEALLHTYGHNIKALFSPQHGLWGEQQANMIETPHSPTNEYNIPIYSLYSERREPAAHMLEGIDCLIIDLQDVGTRVYTFIWTVLKCLQTCGPLGIKVLLLDRPNPIGSAVEGPCLDKGYESFVGLWSIPMRHGSTYGELARLFVHEMNIDVDLEVVPVSHWMRNQLFPELGYHWIAPSPNVPTFYSVLTYPGQVLLEGANLSEGRGTTIPFECVGAPYVNAKHLLEALKPYNLPGLIALPIRFIPTFDKWQGQSCEGLRLMVTNPRAFHSYKTTVAILAETARLWPESFAFNPPPYEYETIKMPIDILSGNTHLRDAVNTHKPLTPEVLNTLIATSPTWSDRMAAVQLYT